MAALLLSPEVRTDPSVGPARILHALLADELVLYANTRNYHRSVSDEPSDGLPQLFVEQYDELNRTVEEVSARARAVGGLTGGRPSEFVKLSRLRESASGPMSPADMLEKLVADHETLVENLKHDVQGCRDRCLDASTYGFLSGVVGRHEATVDLLRARMQDSAGFRARDLGTR